MNGNITLLLPIFVPILMGVLVLMGKRFRENRRLLVGTVAAVLAAEEALVFAALIRGGECALFPLTDVITIGFAVDGVSRLFAALTAVIWLLAGIYSFSYMTHGRDEFRFYGFYLIVFGVLIGLDFSANLVTMYVFYELMTLTSLPLVLHELTKEAVMAGLKYLFYSIAGAFLALFGVFLLAGTVGDLTFIPGGVLAAGGPMSGAAGGMASSIIENGSGLLGKEGLLLGAVFCMIAGFGTKAGMFPLHGWLPAAHPVAPAPASAVLSGIITKSGVLAVIRVVYYIVGPVMIRGTWVQYAWIALALLTVFMGSMLAYKEPVLKKRLAYSTVSQVSYMMFGLALLQPVGFVGALSHVVFHSLIKNALFFVAGAVIFTTGWTRVDEMRGIGRVMPKMLACYTVVSLALVGIPPASGFVSKWYLATGALASQTGVWSWLGPAVLLVSALLTAGYLLPLTIQGFFPGDDFDGRELEQRKLNGKEPSWLMLGPVILLAAASFLFGCFPNGLMTMLESIAAAVL